MEVQCLALKDLTSPRRAAPEEEEEEEEEEARGEHKENICAERRRSPGLLPSRKGPPPDHVTPVKHAAPAEPWTPTANLKMLISAAGPDIRDREMKKVLFRPIENERAAPESPEEAELEDCCQFEAVDEEDEADKKPSRKQKSLGLLCHKFLALYPDYPPPLSPIWISLDEVASSLGVERRRIYDIVNVLESLAIVGRIAKNSYTWYGRLRLHATLEELQRRGRQQGYHLQVDPPASRGPGGAAAREDDGADGDAGNAGGNRKDKSLRIMSQKFVMLFLVSRTQTVTLDAAARILIEEGQDPASHSKYKTKVRRLYDIANVLTSLGLIKKVHVREERGRKPAFKWLGPVDFSAAGHGVAAASRPEATQPAAGPDPRRAKMARHASFSAPPSAAAERRLVNSAPSSPRRDGLPTQPVDYSKKTTSNGAVCRLQFGNGAEPRPSAGYSPQAPPPAPPLQPEQLFAASPSPHCLAYLPSLSQPSVVMLYRAPEGPRSPGAEPDEGRKRRREESEEEETVGKRKGCDESAAPRGEAAPWSPAGLSRTSPRERGLGEGPEPPPPSHYLYVPNNAGLNGLNFLLSAGPPPGGLPHGAVPTLALPYVLVPSAALARYPPGPEAHRGNLSFSLPAHFMVGAGPYGLAAPAEYVGPAAPLPSTPEQSRLYGLAAPHSPSGGHRGAGTHTPEPLTPHTPKEAARSASKAFFQTPGTLGSGVSAAPAARRRGSAQRRLDVGHPPGNRPAA